MSSFVGWRRPNSRRHEVDEFVAPSNNLTRENDDPAAGPAVNTANVTVDEE
jgi:hypothetical protein